MNLEQEYEKYRQSVQKGLIDETQLLDEFSISKSDAGFSIISSRFVHTLYEENQNRYYNKQHLRKEQNAQSAYENKYWSQYIMLHERPYRVEAFLDIMDQLSDEYYWSILGDVWVDSENIWQYRDIWYHLLTSERHGKAAFMSVTDIVLLEKLDEELTIYRGCVDANENGFSYTLSKDKAKWFAERLGKQGKVLVKNVKKSDCFAYVSQRWEAEIIYLKEYKC